ncbi:MAG: GNAT family N-acetyltransferase [Pirellulaceae bacterium]|nr:GNAT family N-acetyltransferase [Pirellulaceae bacterium]
MESTASLEKGQPEPAATGWCVDLDVESCREPQGELTVQRSRCQELEAWHGTWRELAADCFMQQPIWLLNAWNHFHRHQSGVTSTDQAALVVTDAKQRTVACSLWFQQFRHGMRWWRAMGSDALCSDYQRAISPKALSTKVGLAVAEWFDRQPRNRLDLPTLIEVDGHSTDCPQWRAFFEVLGSRGWLIDSVEIDSSWRLTLPGDFATYEASLGKHMRRKFRQFLRVLADSRFELRICRTPAEIEDAWPNFVKLHQQRRQQLGQPGCFADSAYENFLRLTTLEFACQGQAWLPIMFYQQQPLATLLMFDSQHASCSYQSGIDTRHMKLEPGHLIYAAAIRETIGRGKREFDFLRGDEPYKQAWRAERHSLSRTVALPPGWVGRGISSAVKLRRCWRSWKKSQRSNSAIQVENKSS